MSINSTQVYIRDLLQNLTWPTGNLPNLVAYITPPDPDVEANLPKAYVWPSHGSESRSTTNGGTVPRALTVGGPSGFKGVQHSMDVYLVFFGADDDPEADTLFPMMVDTVMSKLRVSTDPVTVTDQYTAIDSWLIDVGETMTYEVTLRSLVDEGYNRYDALIGVSILELIAA